MPPAAPLAPLARDVREGQMWTPLQALKNHALYLAARASLACLSPLPVGWLRLLGRALGRALHGLGLARRLTRDNLALAFPGMPIEGRRSLALRVYVTLGAFLGETVALLHSPARLSPLPFEAGSRAVLEEALAARRGVLFVSAHLGPWERVAGSLVRSGFPLTTLARESYDPRLLAIYERLRGGVGVRAIYRGHGRAPFALVRTLKAGGLLGVPMDLRSRVPSIEVPFLGVPARTAVGPARVALRTGAAVVVGTVARLQGKEGELAIRVTLVPTRDLASTPDDERILTTRLSDELSRRIRAFPEGWVWMHARWAQTDARVNVEHPAVGVG